MEYIEKIKKEMELKDITPSELANKLKKDKSNVIKTLKEEGRYFSIEELKKICEILNISPEYILGFTNNKKTLENIKLTEKILNNEKIVKVADDNFNQIMIKTDKSIIQKKNISYITNIKTEIKDKVQLKNIIETTNYIKQLTEQYRGPEDEIIKEYLIEILEESLDENIEILLYIISGTYINEKETLLQYLIKSIIQKYN